MASGVHKAPANHAAQRAPRLTGGPNIKIYCCVSRQKTIFRVSAVRSWRCSVNPLNMKRRLLYLKTQFVPRSKHFSSRLQKPVSLCSGTSRCLFSDKYKTHKYSRAWGSVVVRRCATRRKVPGSIPGRVTWDYFRSIRQVLVLGVGVDSASKNEYQDIPGKGGRCQEIWEP